MTYRIELTKDADKELREFPKGIQKGLAEATATLADPFSAEVRANAKVLTGYEYVWRMKAGNRRIFYVVDKDTKTVTVIGYSVRNDAYDKSMKRSLDAAEKAEKRKHGSADDVDEE